MKRKASIGVTLNWFAATIVVFFILLLFLVGVGYLGARENRFFQSDISVAGDDGSILREKFISFLISEVEFPLKGDSAEPDGQKMRVIDLMRFIEENREKSISTEYIIYLDKIRNEFMKEALGKKSYDVSASWMGLVTSSYSEKEIDSSRCSGQNSEDILTQVVISKIGRAALCVRRKL